MKTLSSGFLPHGVSCSPAFPAADFICCGIACRNARNHRPYPSIRLREPFKDFTLTGRRYAALRTFPRPHYSTRSKVAQFRWPTCTIVWWGISGAGTRFRLFNFYHDEMDFSIKCYQVFFVSRLIGIVDICTRIKSIIWIEELKCGRKENKK